MKRLFLQNPIEVTVASLLFLWLGILLPMYATHEFKEQNKLDKLEYINAKFKYIEDIRRQRVEEDVKNNLDRVLHTWDSLETVDKY